ncbi:MAG: nuclear transport factor 2 family protein [Actinobacteria bacterium]|nr:nuclear transport factor 2 family protein [Actinomycetota bacterium]
MSWPRRPASSPIPTCRCRCPEGGCPVDDIEAIKQLKARYFRTMDTKDWDGMRTVFTDGVVIDTTESGGPAITGADEFVAFLRDTLSGAITTHHGHMPEIDVTSATTATGIWALHDVIKWPGGTRMEGSGHYHETYEKVDGSWRIASSTLTRLYMDVTPPAGG